MLSLAQSCKTSNDSSPLYHSTKLYSLLGLQNFLETSSKAEDYREMVWVKVAAVPSFSRGTHTFMLDVTAGVSSITAP